MDNLIFVPSSSSKLLVPPQSTFMTRHWGGSAYVFRPSDEALRQSRQNAKFMLFDVGISECIELRQRSTALLPWRIEADNGDTDIINFLTNILNNISRFTQFREVLLKAVWYGRYAINLSYDWVNDYVTISSWAPLHGDKLVWKQRSQIGGDVSEEKWGIRIGVAPPMKDDPAFDWFKEQQKLGHIESTEYGWAYFPPTHLRELAIIHRHIVEDGDYEDGLSAGKLFGVGIRDRIYWEWYQKVEILQWLMDFLEKSALGIELWSYPSGNAEAREETLKAATERVGTGKNILLIPKQPGSEDSFGVNRIEPNMQGANVIKEILTDYFGQRIKRYILGQTLTTEAHATGLGSNLASIHQRTFQDIIRYDSVNLAETLTSQLVHRLLKFNFPNLDYRRYRFIIDVDKDDPEHRMESLKVALENNIPLKKEDIYSTLGFNVV